MFSQRNRYLALGDLPPPTKCDTTVGQIQQLLNGGIKAGAWSPSKLGGPPLLAVNGYADQWTQVGVDAILADKYPDWQSFPPTTIWRMLGEKFEPDSYPFFQCPKAGPAARPSNFAPPPMQAGMNINLQQVLPWVLIGGGLLLAIGARR